MREARRKFPSKGAKCVFRMLILQLNAAGPIFVFDMGFQALRIELRASLGRLVVF